MIETDKQFLDRIEGYEGPKEKWVPMTIRLFALARRGAEAADRIEQLEAEGDKARARGDALRMALEDIASGKYSGRQLLSHPPQDPAVNRALAALEVK